MIKLREGLPIEENKNESKSFCKKNVRVLQGYPSQKTGVCYLQKKSEAQAETRVK